MKAARLLAYGDTSQIVIDDIPQPVPNAGEILVKVIASSLNPVETALRLGYFAKMIPLELPATLGVDLAGEVADVGEGVTAFQKGDRVIGRLGLTGKGTHAEYAIAAVGQLAHLPDNVHFEAASTLPLASLTARQGIDALQINEGDRVLVTGALGSVGRAAVQYLKELGAIPVAAVRESRLAEAATLDVELVTAGQDGLARSFDAGIDTAGGETAAWAVATVKDGKVIAGAARFPDGINADGRVKTVNLFTTDNAAMLQQIADAAGRGDLALPITKTFSLDQLAAAYELLALRPQGKIVITR